MTLRQRILLWVVLLVSITVIVTVAVSTWNGRQILLAHTEAHGVLIATLLARNAGFVQHIPQEAEAMIAEQMLAQATLAAHLVNIGEIAGLNTATLNQHLHTITTNSVIDEFWITDAEGHAYLRSIPEIEFTFSPDPLLQPQAHIFWSLLTGNATQVVQDARQREVDEQIFKYVGVTGIDHPRIVQVGYHAQYLQQLRAQLGIQGMMQHVLATGRVSAVHVVDTQLNLLSSATATATPELTALDSRARTQARIVLHTQTANHYYTKDFLKVAVPMYARNGKTNGTTNGAVLVSLPLSPLNQALFDHLQSAIWTALAMLLLATLSALALSHQLSLPLLSLSHAVQRMSQNNWQFVNLHTRTAEIATLANAFNDMCKQLQHSFASLEKANLELESRVIERTHALREANQQISTLNECLQAENLRMSTQLEVARQLQQMVLPRPEEFHHIDELDIAGFMQPADEVGGDYYDILRHNGRIKIGIGDVTGHGLESGVLMLMVQTAVRTLLANNVSDPQAFLTILNQVIYANVQRMNSDKNLSLLLLDYQQSHQQGHLKISGQHEEVLVVRHTGQIERVNTTDLGFIVGLEADIKEWIHYQDIHLQPGDGVVLYTDGITEAMSASGKFFKVERLCEVVREHWHQSAQGVQEAVIAAVHEHTGTNKHFDDITLVVIKQNAVRLAPLAA